MEARFGDIEIDEDILRAARCEHEYACLGDRPVCETVRFTNRDVELIKCLSAAPCDKRSSCDGMQICTCPVQRRIYGLA